MNYIIYKTRNVVNNKLYIGVHKCTDLNDGYLGSGIGFLNALRKYGKESFVRSILCFCSSEEEMYELEELVVDEDFVRRSDTYNQCIGGDLGSERSGWSAWNSLPYDLRFTEDHKKNISISVSGELNGFYGKWHSDEQKLKWSEYRKTSCLGELNGFYGKKHSEETKSKISKGWEGEAGDIRRNKISEKMKGKKFNIVVCPYCKKEGGGPNMGRYHFENCKKKGA